MWLAPLDSCFIERTWILQIYSKKCSPHTIYYVASVISYAALIFTCFCLRPFRSPSIYTAVGFILLIFVIWGPLSRNPDGVVDSSIFIYLYDMHYQLLGLFVFALQTVLTRYFQRQSRLIEFVFFVFACAAILMLFYLPDPNYADKSLTILVAFFSLITVYAATSLTRAYKNYSRSLGEKDFEKHPDA